MRRDHFTVDIGDGDSADKPMLSIAYDGPRKTLTSQLTDIDEELVSAADIDAAFRLLDDLDADDATGVFSLSHRLTGEYLLEVNLSAAELLTFISRARDGGEDDDETSYLVHIERENDDAIVYEMSSLLVYDADGELLRKQSLIPSGVEL